LKFIPIIKENGSYFP